MLKIHVIVLLEPPATFLVRRTHRYDHLCTVFQIRRGGIKGLLVRYPDEKFDRFCYDTNSRTWDMPMHVIAYRPSMLKYEGGPTVLELNNYAHYPRSARLNVQSILLLLTLGIRREVIAFLPVFLSLDFNIDNNRYSKNC